MARRADDNGPFKEFDLFGWMFDTANCCGADELRHNVRVTVKEQLETVRDILDDVIEKIDEREAAQSQPNA